jgi:hypothetical protein
MSSLTLCNFCSLARIRARVKREHPTHTVEARPAEGEMSGWLQPVRLDESGQVVERIRAWFLELSSSCCC